MTNNKKGREAANTDEDLVEKAKNNELKTIEPENDVDYNRSEKDEYSKIKVKESNKSQKEDEACNIDEEECNYN